MISKRLSIIVATAASALLLAGCASPASPSSAASEAPAEQASDFPRTIEIPQGSTTEASTLTIDAAPEAIAALDYESAEVVAELGLADRLVLVPEAVTNPVLGSHVDEMAEVPHVFPVAMEVSVETVLESAPDLVVMSPRHDAESTIGAVLQQSGVTTLMLPHSWTSPASLDTNIDLIGQATGADGEAAQLRESLSDALTQAPGTDAATGPGVLVLSNQAGRPFITAGHAFPLELLGLAGAHSVSDELGITKTGPITAEQIIEADPDAVLLIDMNGSGERLFSELLENPAVATVPGTQNTLLVEGKDVQALGLMNTADGLSELQDWVASIER